MVRARDHEKATVTRTVRRRAVYYPSGDGKPLAESYVHAMTMYDVLARLQHHYAGRENVHFGINSFVYFVEGDPQRRVAPDVYMVLGVPPRTLEERESYRLWEEGVPPAIVFELTSPKTRTNDLTTKRAIYAGMGVREYILFDPKRQYLHPPLRGFVLTDGAFAEQTPEADGSLVSEVLHARLTPAGTRLDFFDLTTGERWLTALEAEQEKAAHEAQRAEDEARQRQEADQRAAQEKERADRAEAELRALRAQLEARRGNGHGTNGAANG